ncbi:MAG TPA: DUF488 family protein [Polyangiales bacterium]|nr:DUF488 family protein [Polyangiales bacterium]
MPVRTKRWNDPPSPDDGYRLLICRYRPRGVRKSDEPWDGFCPALGPSTELHALVYGKTGEPPLEFPEYARRFREEMGGRGYWIESFAKRVRAGDTITLLCSSACVDELVCHRTIVKELMEAAAFPDQLKAKTVVRRSR